MTFIMETVFVLKEKTHTKHWYSYKYI